MTCIHCHAAIIGNPHGGYNAKANTLEWYCSNACMAAHAAQQRRKP